MADGKNWSDDEKRLDALITRVQQHQEELGIGDTPFVARYARYLGSAKTWRDRMCGRVFMELKILAAIERMTALIDIIENTAYITSKINETIPMTAYALAAYEVMDSRQDDRRVAWLIGPTGVGKTWAMQAVMRKARGASAFIQVDSTWKDRPSTIAVGIAQAIGCQASYSAAESMKNVMGHLRGNKMIICVDDVQDMGVSGLKILKSMVDKTSARLLLGIYPTGWASLLTASTAARAEANQLLGRSIKPMLMHWLSGLRDIDVETFMRINKVQGPTLRASAARMAPHLRSGGNFRTLADAIEAASTDAHERDIPLTSDLVEQHAMVLLNKAF
jgi:hypothetical protein